MADWKKLVDEYVAAPAILRKAIAGMSHEQLLARPVAGKMSTLEVVVHLADFDPIIADRMKRIIALDNPPLIGADDKLYTEKLHYHDRNLEEELAIIDLTRSQVARILRKLPDSAWARTGQHSEKGPLTLEQMVALGTRHIVHHVKFIEEKRKALGLAV